MTRYVKVPNYEELKLTEAGATLLRRVHDHDQGARSDDDGRRESVYHCGPAEGRAAQRLERQGLIRLAAATGSVWIGYEATAAGCAVLAAMAGDRA